MIPLNNSFTVNPFDPAVDNPAEIAQLHLEVRQGQITDDDNIFSDLLASQRDLNAIDVFYIEPGGNFFVARDSSSGMIAGFVGIRNEGNGIGQIKRLAVIKPFRHRGIGFALVDAAVSWASKHGYQRACQTNI